MKTLKPLMLCTLLALLLLPAALFGQEQAPAHGSIEFGFQGVTGDVYGRTNPGSVPFYTGLPSDPFSPGLLGSALNTYTDYRNGFVIPKATLQIPNALGSDTYFNVQGANSGAAFEGMGTLYRDQSLLATAGKYGVYKFQLRLDETPHIFSDTTRTVFSPNGAGGWNVNPTLATNIYNCLSAPTASLASACPSITNTMFPGFSASTPNFVPTRVYGTMATAISGNLGASGAEQLTMQTVRRMGSGSVSWNVNPNWNVSMLFSREHQLGTRPLGMILGTGAGGYNAEVPETIDDFTNNLKIGTEFGQKSWAAQLAYQGSFFENNVSSMLVESPYVSPSLAPSAWTTASGPGVSRMGLYPDNKYQQFISQGATDVGKYVRLMANVTPGLMTQNEQFAPVSTNSTFLSAAIPAGFNATSNSPTNSLQGDVHTLAMNYTAVVTPMKKFQTVARYMQYDYDNRTPEWIVRDVENDVTYFGACNGASSAVAGFNGYCTTDQTSFSRKTFDVSGTYFITKKNSAKFGYQREWMDRQNRNVGLSIENSIYGAVDLNLRKNVLLRVSGRHQDRQPQDYDNNLGYSPNTPADFYYLRMYDQAARLRNRGDVSLQWDPTDRLSVTAFWGTLQDNYNIKNSLNSLLPLGDTTGAIGTFGGASALVATVPGTAANYINPIYGPYYIYGLLNNIGRNYGVDVNYVLTNNVTLFAEYAREKNTGVIVGGNQKSTSTCALVGGFYPSSACDPINDVVTFTKDVVDTYYAGADMALTKKVSASVYYSLSAAQSYMNSNGVNCQTGSNCFNIFKNWSDDSAASPSLTFGFPENVAREHEVGAILKFRLTNRLTPKVQYRFQQFDNKDWQTGVVNPVTYNPNLSQVDNTALAKMLYLGSDQPSYRAHVITGTLEYRF